jgi:hypothetical protein
MQVCPGSVGLQGVSSFAAAAPCLHQHPSCHRRCCGHRSSSPLTLPHPPTHSLPVSRSPSLSPSLSASSPCLNSRVCLCFCRCLPLLPLPMSPLEYATRSSASLGIILPALCGEECAPQESEPISSPGLDLCFHSLHRRTTQLKRRGRRQVTDS